MITTKFAYYTLYFYNNELSKNKHFLILLSSLAWNLQDCESFLRKSQFSKLRYLNPGFGGSWDMLGIFFVNVIFITLQNKSFGQKFFWIPYMGSKVPFCQSWKIAKMALLILCMEFKNIFGQKTFLKCFEDGIYKKYSYYVHQIQDLGTSI